MKKLLVLNGSHSDIQLIQAGKELGFYVITTGNTPELIGHNYSDEYHSADFSNPEQILQLAKKLKIDAICSCANDFGAIAAAYVAEKMGLAGHDSYETTLILHHKDKFKKFAKENNIITPIAQSYEKVEDALKDIVKYQFPLIIKPIDLTGGKGVSKVINRKEYEEAVRKAYTMSVVSRFIIEPFIEGTYHSFSTFVVNKEVVACFSDNEYSYINPFLVSTSAGPADSIEAVKNILIDEANRIVKLLNLADGVFHIQYVMKDKKPYILEITRRCSGDWYSEPVRQALNVNWAKYIVKAECGMDCSDFPKNLEQQGYYGRHCIMSEVNGIVEDIIISDEIKENIYDSILWCNNGYIINDYMKNKVGILFLKYASQEEMIYKTKKINELVRVKLKENNIKMKVGKAEVLK